MKVGMLRLVVAVILLVAQLPLTGSVEQGRDEPPTAAGPPATTTPPAPATPDLTPTDDGSTDTGCTLRHAATTETKLSGDRPRVTVNVSLRSLDTDGAYDKPIVRYHVTFAQPAAVTNLTVRPHGAEVVTTEGFTRAGGWFIATNATAALTVQVEPRAAQFGWAFAEPPVVTYRWTSGDNQYCTFTMAEQTPLAMTTQPGLNVSYTEQGVFISPGQHMSRTVTVEDTTIRIVYDANRSGARFDPARAEAELTTVARHVDVAAATERVTVFALPASASEPAMTYGWGFDPSTRTLTVSTAHRLGGVGGVLTHEYIHALQTFRVGERMQWFVEGSAEYYTHLLPYQLTVAWDSATAHRRAAHLIQQVRHARESVLTEPATWTGNTQYHQGAAAVLVLDNRLREASNGTYTMVDMVRWMNTHEGTVTYEEFRHRLVLWGNASVGRWLDTHVAGRAPYSAASVAFPSTDPVTDGDHATHSAWPSSDPRRQGSLDGGAAWTGAVDVTTRVSLSSRNPPGCWGCHPLRSSPRRRILSDAHLDESTLETEESASGWFNSHATLACVRMPGDDSTRGWDSRE